MHNDIENICFGGGLNIFPSYYSILRRRRFEHLSLSRWSSVRCLTLLSLMVEHLKVLISRACLRTLSDEIPLSMHASGKLPQHRLAKER